LTTTTGIIKYITQHGFNEMLTQIKTCLVVTKIKLHKMIKLM